MTFIDEASECISLNVLRHVDNIENAEIDFVSYYRELYRTESTSDPFHDEMKHLVENKMSCLKDARMHSTITITDVREAINNLSTGKAVGFDSIPSEMFKAGVNTALSIVVTWLMDAM